MDEIEFINNLEKADNLIYERTKKYKKDHMIEDLIQLYKMCKKMTNDNYKCIDCHFYKINVCAGLDKVRDNNFDELLAEQQEQM